jgi:molecular chaperone GrpE (heat shock protein)
MAQDPGSDPSTSKSAQATDAAPAAEADQQASAKKSTAEHFADLRDTVIQLRMDIDEVSQFTRSMSKKLMIGQAEATLKAQASILETLFEVHDLLFKRVHGADEAATEPDEFSASLLDAIEAILSDRHGIEPICPAEGDPIDPIGMQLLDLAPCEGDAKPDTVARVHHCGFAKLMEGGAEAGVIRKAAVIVYRVIKNTASSA